MKTRALASLLAVVLTTSTSSMAETPASEAATEEEREMDSVLIRADESARLWQAAWVGIFGAAVATQGVLASVGETGDERLGAAFGAIPPAVGIVLAIVDAPAALSLDTDRLELQSRDAAARRRSKSELLRRYAASESQQRGVFAHLGPLVLNASVAALTWRVADQPIPAVVQLGAGTLLSELRVFTSPRAASSWASTPRSSSLRVTPTFSGTWFGLVGVFP
ncbi:MAG: hypothetical protein JST00_34760 [Deltaproteobacteria bacterium]|nr:hypothetical protein [Deltaproteobacteria bacterium]